MTRIDYLGLSGFPYGLAAVEKQKLIARGLVHAGADVTIICNRWGSFNSELLERSGTFMGVKYIYTSPVLIKPASFLKRRMTLFMGWLKEILLILFRKQDIFIVSSEDFFQVFIYACIAKLKRKKIFLTYVEDVNVLFTRSWLNNLKIRLFNKFTWHIIDGAFPISEYLMDQVRTKNNSLPLLKLPTLVDFSLFSKIRVKRENYFLFCGAAQYLEIITFIIQAFEKLDEKDYFLYLVANGSITEIESVKKIISQSSKYQKIKLFGFLDYEDLIEKYINSSGLLIPLRNNVRDIARFPHKIGEYCASRVPIISTDIGEIHYYFTNRVSALMAKNFDIDEFAGEMQYVIDNPLQAREIGNQSRLTGEENFDYKKVGMEIHSFMVSR